ncbi:hypothetical protein [Paenibacillus assamensis]|uniref:hypothetical protein n=1 Tax=Paenibacillus assamensis TaxID=311244 RepID=UPI00048BF212|nr:hypothetical protein [Paenibacillus assamensis]
MKKIFLVVFALTLLFVFTSCNKSVTPDTNELWLPSLNEAIEHGLQTEEASLLLTQEYKGIHYALIAKVGGEVALARINKKDKGYLWERVTLYLGIPSYVGAEFTTESGEKIPIIIGITEKTSKKIKLERGSRSVVLDVHNGYYIGFDLSINGRSFTVTVIE